MLPRYHILLGALFALLLWIIFPSISLHYLLIVFLASIFIDIDHYLCALNKTGKLGLFSAFDYHKKQGIEHLKEHNKGIRNKGDFHIFHTIEFHLLILVLGIFWPAFFFIFIGMLFHSFLDIAYLSRYDFLYRREFLLANWLKKTKRFR